MVGFFCKRFKYKDHLLLTGTRFAFTTEWLYANHRTDDVTIDVDVTDMSTLCDELYRFIDTECTPKVKPKPVALIASNNAGN